MSGVDPDKYSMFCHNIPVTELCINFDPQDVNMGKLGGCNRTGIFSVSVWYHKIEISLAWSKISEKVSKRVTLKFAGVQFRTVIQNFILKLGTLVTIRLCE